MYQVQTSVRLVKEVKLKIKTVQQEQPVNFVLVAKNTRMHICLVPTVMLVNTNVKMVKNMQPAKVVVWGKKLKQ